MAVALATVVIGYYFVIGGRYFTATGQIVFMTSKIGQLTQEVDRPVPDEGKLNDAMAALEALRDERQLAFSYRDSDELTEIISKTAIETRVVLRSLTIGGIEGRVEGPILYQTQNANMVISGDVIGVFRFLEVLHERMEGSGVADLRLSGVDTNPQANVSMTFYMSPVFVQGDTS